MNKKSNYSQIIKFLFLFFCLSGCQLFSVKTEKVEPAPEKKEEVKKTEEPKIGLFISGAGANTFSVVPILELFQTKNLHFDFISGTGWGAWLGRYLC